MSEPKYTLTKEHQEQLKLWADEWIRNAMSTKPMDEEEREKCRAAVRALYKSSGLPEPKRIVFVSSPFVLRFAGGFASALWHLAKKSGLQIPELIDEHSVRLGSAAAATADIHSSVFSATEAKLAASARNEEWTYSIGSDAYRGIRAVFSAVDQAAKAAEPALEAAVKEAADDLAGRAISVAAQAAAQASLAVHEQSALKDDSFHETRKNLPESTVAALGLVATVINLATDASQPEAEVKEAQQDLEAAASAVTKSALSSVQSGTLEKAEWAACAFSKEGLFTSNARTASPNAFGMKAASEAAAKSTEKEDEERVEESRLQEWWVTKFDAARAAAELGLGKFGLRCAIDAWKMWQGGNWDSPWESFLTFFRHVVKLPLDYSRYDAWETLAKHSGPRIVHPDFCMISDRPEILLVDEQNRPHCETGPFCRWRDGSALYAVHGVRVPAWIVELPHLITVQKIEEQQNSEVRRVMIDRMGVGEYLRQSGARKIAQDSCGILWRTGSRNQVLTAVEVRNSTAEADGSFKTYFIKVPATVRTAREGVAWSFGMEANEYRPLVET